MEKRHDHFFAVTAPGFEAICVRELGKIGISPLTPVPGGVEFSGMYRELYLANMWLRSASRILVRVGNVAARDFPTLYKRLSRLPWGRFVKPGTRCEIRAVSQQSRLIHTGRMAEVCLSAIAKSLGKEAESSGVAQKIYLRMRDDSCQVSIDSSGEHLHRRGYRQARVVAPLRETLAAGCLLACHYDGTFPLVDLMTGSGTLAIEAALIALNSPPGKGRSFAFMEWPKYRPGLWNHLLDEALRKEKRELVAPIIAIDNNPRAISAASQNLKTAGLEHIVQLRCGDMQEFTPSSSAGLVICNPPYGERLGKSASLQALYRDIGHVYGEKFATWEGAIICPELDFVKNLKLNFTPCLYFSNGGIRVALLKKS